MPERKTDPPYTLFLASRSLTRNLVLFPPPQQPVSAFVWLDVYARPAYRYDSKEKYKRVREDRGRNTFANSVSDRHKGEKKEVKRKKK